jgi:hypothetical protein
MVTDSSPTLTAPYPSNLLTTFDSGGQDRMSDGLARGKESAVICSRAKGWEGSKGVEKI